MGGCCWPLQGQTTGYTGIWKQKITYISIITLFFLRLEDQDVVINIRMDLEEMGWGGMDWIGITQDRDTRRALVNAV
jgi:hypothetical protein